MIHPGLADNLQSFQGLRLTKTEAFFCFRVVRVLRGESGLGVPGGQDEQAKQRFGRGVFNS